MTEHKVKLVCKRNIQTSLGVEIEPDDILGPLLDDQGVIFPYTPVINVTHNASYGAHQPLHSNFSYKFFQNYSIQGISCAADFTAATVAEAQYTVAALHFFKSCMKIGFGEQDSRRGIPPPVLNFSGYGPIFFKDMPVVITDLTYALDSNTDYVFAQIEERTAGGVGPIRSKFNKTIVEETFIPIKTSFILSLAPCYSTYQTRVEFNLKDFVKGDLLNKGYG